MTYYVKILREAQNDLKTTFEWYENRQLGLGDEFLIAFENEKRYIERNPLQFEQKYNGIRKAIIKRFPYIIYFEPLSNQVVIYAVLHAKRSLANFQRRLKNFT